MGVGADVGDVGGGRGDGESGGCGFCWLLLGVGCFLGWVRRGGSMLGRARGGLMGDEGGGGGEVVVGIEMGRVWGGVA